MVWDILTDLARYAEWNPFVRKASGTIALHETLYCEPLLPGSSRRMRFRPRVTCCIEGAEFAWTGVQVHPKISAGEHRFRIERIADDRVRLIHAQVFMGLLAPLVLRVGGDRTRQGFELMNRALKARAEAQVY